MAKVEEFNSMSNSKSQYSFFISRKNPLEELGYKYQPSKRNHNYLLYYWMHFRDIRFDVRSVLEIGLQTDRSIKMWEEFFPNAIIYGIDLEPKCLDFQCDRRKIFIGDQGDSKFLKSVAKRAHKPFDIIIDDGSHIPRHQVETFQTLFPLMSDHGIYVIEDTGGCVRDFNLVTVNSLKNHIDNIMYWPKGHDPRNWLHLNTFPNDASWADKNIIGIAFYRWIVFVMRGMNPEDNPYLKEKPICCPQPTRSEPANRFQDQDAGSENINLSFMQIHTFYPSYLQDFYAARPHLTTTLFNEQIAALIADGFSAIHMFAPYMEGLGYRAQLIVANDQRSQARWLSEQKQFLQSGDDWVREVVRRQIDTLKPDVLYLSDPITFDGRFLRTLTHKPALVLGWRAAVIPDGTDWSGFDLILSGLESLRQAALKLGARGAEHFLPGYPEWINARITDSQVKHDVVFCGQWSLGLHANRNRYLQALAEAASDAVAPFSLGLYLSGQLDTLTPEVAKYSLPACYGVEMQRALHRGRIAIDARAMHFARDPASGHLLDLCGRQTANMRLFEATGCGVFLLAEYHDNLKDYFELGVEIETFRDERELIEKVHYYLAHPEEREAIARRGQARCLADYSMERRAAEMDRLIRKHLAS